MIRKNKKVILIGALVMLIPVLAGLILWNRLPDTIATHWNAAGEPDGFSGKAFTVFGLNGIMYALYAICIFGTAADPKKENISAKNFSLVISIIPAVSLFANSVTFAAALGKNPDVPFFSKLLIVVVLLILGNYMPKMRQSYTLGIKLPWTLSSEDNWNRTHRFTGKIWMLFGLVLLADVFFGFLRSWMYPALLIVMILIPMAYSYLYYKKNENSEK